MATAAQIAANQANAQTSTGPRWAEGKSASRFNALKHALAAPTSPLDWPPTDEKTGRPMYFAG